MGMNNANRVGSGTTISFDSTAPVPIHYRVTVRSRASTTEFEHEPFGVVKKNIDIFASTNTLWKLWRI